jgi:hypothetical protein
MHQRRRFHRASASVTASIEDLTDHAPLDQPHVAALNTSAALRRELRGRIVEAP